MPRIKYLQAHPTEKLFYLVDTCFLVNRYIQPSQMIDPKERDIIIKSQDWWKIIDAQIKTHKAVVYVLNVSIAEAFKTLFKQYIKGRIKQGTYQNALKNMRQDLILTPRAF